MFVDRCKETVCVPEMVIVITCGRPHLMAVHVAQWGAVYEVSISIIISIQKTFSADHIGP